MTEVVEDWEKHRAIEAILEELPQLLETNEKGYSEKAQVWEELVRRGLEACAETLEARNS